MKKVRKQTVCGFISMVGFFQVLGVAGGLDLGTLTIKQAIVHSVIGLTLMAGAAYKGGFMKW